MHSPCGAEPHDHLVEFYETDEYLTDTVASFIGPSLQSGDSAIIVATAEHRALFAALLRAMAVDVDAAEAEGRLLVFDAAELLTHFMVQDGPDRELFRATVGAKLREASAGGRSVRVYGEMVALLWDAGDIASAIALEDLWNELAEIESFELLCAYPMSSFQDESCIDAFRRICDQHSEVIPSEGFSLLAGDDQQRREVAALQQQATQLRADLERMRAEQDVLAELAFVDPITGLCNRRAFDRHLEREWALALRDGIDSFVLVADLDGFKKFNDTHGHAAGDEALRAFADALRTSARRTDILARIGGDEFGVLLVRCEERAAQSFKARVLEAMDDLGTLGPAGLGVSIGHASLQGSNAPAKALQRADLAMFARKRFARGGRR